MVGGAGGHTLFFLDPQTFDTMGLFTPTKAPEQEFIEILDFAFKFGKGIQRALQDGQFSFQDTVFFVDPMIALPLAITGAGGVVDLFESFSDEQKQTVYDFVEAEYPNLAGSDQADRLIKATIKWAVGTFQLIGGWRGLAREPQA